MIFHANTSFLQVGMTNGDRVQVTVTDQVDAAESARVKSVIGGVLDNVSLAREHEWIEILAVAVVLIVGTYCTQLGKSKVHMLGLKPHFCVAGSAILAAVLSMQAANLQVREGLSAPLLAFVVACISLLFHGGELIFVGQDWFAIQPRSWMWLVIHGVLVGNTPVLAFLGIAMNGLSRACALMFTMPLWTALFASLFTGAPWGGGNVIMAIACAVGVVLVLEPRSLFGTSNGIIHYTGIFCSLGFAIFNAIGILVCNSKLREEKASLVSFVMMGIAVIFAAFASLFVAESWTALSKISAATVVQALLTGGLMTATNTLRMIGLISARSSTVAVMLYLEILAANLLDIFVVHGNVTVISGIGSAIILIGCVVSASWDSHSK